MNIYATQITKSKEIRVAPHRGGNGAVLWLPDGGRLTLTEGSCLALIDALEEIVYDDEDEDEELIEE